MTLDRQPPHNIEAEQAVLGSIMIEPDAIHKVMSVLKGEDFFVERHRWIWEAAITITERHHPIDYVALVDELERHRQIDDIGGSSYITSLINTVPTAAHIETYAELVERTSVLRKLIAAAGEIAGLAYKNEGELTDIIDKAEQAVFAVSQRKLQKDLVPISQYLNEVSQSIEYMQAHHGEFLGVPTHFSALDKLLGGLQPGDLVIVAGRPSIGKCLAADSEILLADGSLATIEEIYRRRAAHLLTLRNDWRLHFAQPSAYVDDGIKPVYAVTTKLGRRIETTASHPFLTMQGWKPLAEFKTGTRIAVPRRLAIFGEERLSEAQVKLLGYLIGDGGLTHISPRFTNSNPLLQQDYAHAVAEFPGLKLRTEYAPAGSVSFEATGDMDFIVPERRQFGLRLDAILAGQPRGIGRRLAATLGVSPALISTWRAGQCVPNAQTFAKLCRALNVPAADLAPYGLAAISHNSQNPLTLWLEEMGMWGKGAHAKTVPPVVFRLARAQVALFLNRLFATDGWVALSKNQKPQIGYASVSERLARQVQHLLLRFGVIARLRRKAVKYQGGRRTAYQLDITHGDSIRTFAEEIGIFGKEQKLSQAVSILSSVTVRHNRDLIPTEIWETLARAKGTTAWSDIAQRANIAGYSNIHVGKRALSRKRLLMLADALADDKLAALATSDVYWDEIVSIESVGEKQVYDLTIPETHNFVANDVCVHNTGFALNIVQNAALHLPRKISAVFSLEMAGEQIAQRLIANMTGIDGQRLRMGQINDDEHERMIEAIGRLSEAPIYIDDTAGATPNEVRSKSRRLYAEHGLDMVVIDYLQLMHTGARTENRVQEIATISRSLKALARELRVPVIALSQLSRAVESRPDKHPQLSDLRESGSIEQDADVVMFLYRDDAYDKMTEKPNIAEVIVAKHRNGPTGTVELHFNRAQSRFADLEYYKEEEADMAF